MWQSFDNSPHWVNDLSFILSIMYDCNGNCCWFWMISIWKEITSRTTNRQNPFFYCSQWIWRKLLRYVTCQISDIILYQNIKIINHSDSISANLNNTMQTKQHAMKKTHSYSNRNKIYKELFLWWQDFEQKMSKIFNFC